MGCEIAAVDLAIGYWRLVYHSRRLAYHMYENGKVTMTFIAHYTTAI